MWHSLAACSSWAIVATGAAINKAAAIKAKNFFMLKEFLMVNKKQIYKKFF
jgi:hypothetical protein